jgi:hypothetical protein
VSCGETPEGRRGGVCMIWLETTCRRRHCYHNGTAIQWKLHSSAISASTLSHIYSLTP